MKNNSYKFVINIVIILLVLCVVLYFSLREDYLFIINSIRNMNLLWVLLAVIILFIYRALVSFSHYLLIQQNHEYVSFWKILQINFIILFFHGITPFAGGGQPMEVFYLHQEGINIPKATNITLQNFIVYQISLVTTGFFALIYNYFFHLFPNDSFIKHLVVLGFIINLMVLVVTYILSFGKRLNQFILKRGIHLIYRFHFIDDEEKVQKKFKVYLDHFHENAVELKQSKYKIIFYVFINILALVCLYSMPFVIATGLGCSVMLLDVIVATAYVMIIGSFVPIPGGTGGIEYGFMFFYGYLIQGSILNAVMLVWRFVSYYVGMIIGAVALAFYRRGGKQ